MAEEKPQRQDGSQPERATGQRQDHRAAPPGHKIPGETPNLDDPEGAATDSGPSRAVQRKAQDADHGQRQHPPGRDTDPD